MPFVSNQMLSKYFVNVEPSHNILSRVFKTEEMIREKGNTPWIWCS